MQAYVKTDVGLVRENNEDSFVFAPPYLFVVADGMGGHAAGEIASTLAAQTVAAYVTEHQGQLEPEQMLAEAIRAANTKVHQRAQMQETFAGMGTTLTAVYVVGEVYYWGHVGDSRLYHWQTGGLSQVTQDHSLVGELLQSGSITKEEASRHPKRNILTRALGTSCLIEVDTGHGQWQPGECLLLCSDGLTGMVEEAVIAQQLNQVKLHGEAALDSLIGLAKEAGGVDNITAIVLANEAVV